MSPCEDCQEAFSKLETAIDDLEDSKREVEDQLEKLQERHDQIHGALSDLVSEIKSSAAEATRAL